jgi:hypothetical protein
MGGDDAGEAAAQVKPALVGEAAARLGGREETGTGVRAWVDVATGGGRGPRAHWK